MTKDKKNSPADESPADPALWPRIAQVRAFVETFDSARAAADEIKVSEGVLSKALGKDSTSGRLDSIEGKIALWQVPRLLQEIAQLREAAGEDLGSFRIEDAPVGKQAPHKRSTSAVVYELTDGDRVVMSTSIVVDIDPNTRRHDISQRFENGADHPPQP